VIDVAVSIIASSLTSLSNSHLLLLKNLTQRNLKLHRISTRITRPITNLLRLRHQQKRHFGPSLERRCEADDGRLDRPAQRRRHHDVDLRVVRGEALAQVETLDFACRREVRVFDEGVALGVVVVFCFYLGLLRIPNLNLPRIFLQRPPSWTMPKYVYTLALICSRPLRKLLGDIGYVSSRSSTLLIFCYMALGNLGSKAITHRQWLSSSPDMSSSR